MRDLEYITTIIGNCDRILSYSGKIASIGSDAAKDKSLELLCQLDGCIRDDIGRYTDIFLKCEEEEKDAYVDMLLDLGECLSRITEMQKLLCEREKRQR